MWDAKKALEKLWGNIDAGEFFRLESLYENRSKDFQSLLNYLSKLSLKYRDNLKIRSLLYDFYLALRSDCPWKDIY